MFYAGAERHYVVEAILDSTTRGGTVIITAPEGGGVSTVLGYAAMRLVDYATVVRIDAEQVHSKNELMSSLLSYFDVPKDDFLSALNHALAQGPLVVLVDNGQQLSSELLELLAKLQQHFAGAFAVVVGGQTPLKDNVVASEAWAEASFITLPPLTAAQASEFLLKVRSAKVSEEQLAQDAQEFWPQALMERPLPMQFSALPWKHVALAVVLILLLVLVWALNREPREDKIKLAITPIAETEKDMDSVQELEPEELVLAPAPKKDTRKPSAIEERAARDIVFDPEAKRAQEEKAKQEQERQQEIEELEQKELEKVPAPVINDVPPPTSKDKQQEDVAESSARSNSWLAAQDAELWMAQITLATTEQQAQELCGQLGLNKTAYYRAIRNNRSVYIVLLGAFASRDEAKDALAKLPSEFAEQGPFLRQLAHIQAEL